MKMRGLFRYSLNTFPMVKEGGEGRKRGTGGTSCNKGVCRVLVEFVHKQHLQDLNCAKQGAHVWLFVDFKIFRALFGISAFYSCSRCSVLRRSRVTQRRAQRRHNTYVHTHYNVERGGEGKTRRRGESENRRKRGGLLYATYELV